MAGPPDAVKGRQIRELVSGIRAEGVRMPRIVMGDFNVSPGDIDPTTDEPVLKPMRRLFRDVLGRRSRTVATSNAEGRPCPTGTDNTRLDYIFVRHLRVEAALVPKMSDAKNESDHCPVVARLLVP